MAEACAVFTARQLALALGCTRERVRQMLIGIAPAGTRQECGQATTAWSEDQFPAHVAAKLASLAKRSQCRDVAHFLEEESGPWQPKIPWNEIDERQREEATLRREILAQRMEGLPVATAAKIARDAVADLARLPSLERPSERTVLRWIARAIERDRLRGEWRRAALYLDDKLARQPEESLKPAPSALSAASSSSSTSSSLTAFWLECCQEIALRVRAGDDERIAMSAMLPTVRQRPELAAKTRDANKLALRRAWEQFRDTNEIRDRRKDGKGGRRPAAAAMPQEWIPFLREQTANGASQVLALENFARSPHCPDELKAEIEKPRASRHNIPPSLRSAVRATPELKAFACGDRAYRYLAHSVARDGTQVLADGRRAAIEPGDWWQFDDMSENHPFYYERLEGTDELSRRQGCGIGRQGLYAMDVASGMWLGCELIGREGDSYRKEDVLRFFRRLFSLYGLPRFGIHIERGVWKSRTIAGMEIDAGDGEKFWLSLAEELGIRIVYAHDAKGKGLIETGFGYLQRIMTLAAAGAPSFGKTRGERERDTLKIMRVRSGTLHPREAGILEMAVMGERIGQAMAFANNQRKEGRIQNGVPEERWNAATAADPLRRLSTEKVHVLFPEKRPLEIRGNSVTARVDGREFRFSNPGAFAPLGSRYRTVLCFDPDEPTQGAVILSAESAGRSFEGLKSGAFICTAEHIETSPYYLPANMPCDGNVDRRKRAHRAFRAHFVTPGTFGRKGVRADEARDGRGNVDRIEQGASALELGNRGEPTNQRAERLKANAYAMRRPTDDFDEDAELERIARKEREAIERGDLLA